jgi:hypothetical protein
MTQCVQIAMNWSRNAICSVHPPAALHPDFGDKSRIRLASMYPVHIPDRDVFSSACVMLVRESRMGTLGSWLLFAQNILASVYRPCSS